MKSGLIMLCLVFAVAMPLRGDEGPVKTYTGPKEKLHIYLLIGQSNMSGRAPFTAEEAAPIDRCYLLKRDDQWEQAKNPLNNYSTIERGGPSQMMNPGYMFSKTMLEADKNISIGLVVNAKGGTKIEQWGKGTQFYREAVRRAKAAQKTGTLKGILWHQGECSFRTDGYMEKLKAIIEGLRADLGTPDLPFVAGQIKQDLSRTTSFNNLLAKLPETVPYTGVASSEGLTTKDMWHFNAESMRKLGTRYAEAMLAVQKKLTDDGVVKKNSSGKE